MAATENWIEVGQLRWFYRAAQPLNATDRRPVILLHGLPSQSYSWRGVLPALAEQGFPVIAPDWIGFGFSAQPDRRDFAYTPEAFIQALGDFLDQLEIQECSLVAQGFLGTVGLQFALRHPERIHRLAILNAPITTDCRLPWKIKQMSLPLVGDMMTQDPLLVDRTLEGGGGYRIEDADLDIYRRPFLRSSDAGRALLATLQNLRLKEVTAEIATGLSHWQRPLLIAWGDRDPWLPLELIKPFASQLSDAKLVKLEEVGHYPQEDWHEKVSDALLPFLKSMD